jgi:hypothetical protein
MTRVKALMLVVLLMLVVGALGTAAGLAATSDRPAPARSVALVAG